MLNRPLDRTDDDNGNGLVWGLPLTAWVQIVAVSVLMCALFRFNLARLWGKTNPINGQDSNWQHAIFVPLIGIYYLYIHRDELLRAAAMPRVRERSIRILSAIGVGVMAAAAAAFVSAGETHTPLMLVLTLLAGLIAPVIRPTSTVLGGVLLFEGLLVFAYGIFPGQNDYIKDLGMVITIFGTATLLAGWPVMKIAWFPIAFLVVALPWPELVYSKLAWPLQKLAASAAVGTLRACGVTAQNFGTKITMFDKAGMARTLNVAEACAGLKSVMTFLMVGATVAFLSQRPLWEKLIITASAVPIAIFCNVVRVCGQGLLDRYVSHEWSEGFAHQFAGLVMVIPGFFLILLVGWLLDQMFIEEVDEGAVAAAGASSGGGAAAAAAMKGSKRMIVEVPRKKLAAGPAVSTPAVAAESDTSKLEVATPGVPVTSGAAASTPGAAPAAAETPAVPRRAAAAPAATPNAATGPVVPPRSSTLKAPPTAATRPAAAGTEAGGSTLKPSSKPAAPRAVTPPASGLKPSTLKPPAARPAAGTTPGAPATPRPAAAPAQPKRPAPNAPVAGQAARPPQAPRPPAVAPAPPKPRPAQAGNGEPRRPAGPQSNDRTNNANGEERS